MSTPKYLIYYIFVLIALLIAVAYYKGASKDLGAFGTAADKTIMFLQGRKSNGQFANYPNGG